MKINDSCTIEERFFDFINTRKHMLDSLKKLQRKFSQMYLDVVIFRARVIMSQICQDNTMEFKH
jgi:hypothetical protein